MTEIAKTHYYVAWQKFLTYGSEADVHEQSERISKSVVREGVLLSQQIIHHPLDNVVLYHHPCQGPPKTQLLHSTKCILSCITVLPLPIHQPQEGLNDGRSLREVAPPTSEGGYTVE